jgi:hypothetical protein
MKLKELLEETDNKKLINRIKKRIKDVEMIGAVEDGIRFKYKGNIFDGYYLSVSGDVEIVPKDRNKSPDMLDSIAIDLEIAINEIGEDEAKDAIKKIKKDSTKLKKKSFKL